MWGVVELPTYLAGVVLIILLPGPNSLYVLSVAARRGARSGYAAAAGVWTGDAVLMTLSAAGVASLLKANDVAFGIVKYLGAGYLAWLAIGLLRASWSTLRNRQQKAEQLADAIADARPARTRGERPYRRALVISLLNPKAILFFVAFFVQFVDPAYTHPALSFLLLGTIAQVASVVYLSALIFGGTRLSAAFRRRRVLTAGATSAVGAAFLGFAVKLSLAHA